MRAEREMAVKRANACVKKHCLRACISTAWKEEGGDLGLVVPERFLGAEEAWDHWLTWDADRKLVVQKLDQCSDDFLASSKARTGRWRDTSDDELCEWEVYKTRSPLESLARKVRPMWCWGIASLRRPGIGRQLSDVRIYQDHLMTTSLSK